MHPYQRIRQLRQHGGNDAMNDRHIAIGVPTNLVDSVNSFDVFDVTGGPIQRIFHDPSTLKSYSKKTAVEKPPATVSKQQPTRRPQSGLIPARDMQPQQPKQMNQRAKPSVVDMILKRALAVPFDLQNEMDNVPYEYGRLEDSD